MSCRKTTNESTPKIIEESSTVPSNFDEEKELLAHSVGTQSYFFGVPIMTMMYFRNKMHKMVSISQSKKTPLRFSPSGDDGLDFNEIIHTLNLTNHQMETGGSANTDTRYSITFYNLEHGAQVLTVPAIKDRYWSMNITDGYLANEPYICSRLGDVNGGTYLLTGPGWKGEVPDGMIHRKNPQNNFFSLLRIFVTDPETDMDNVTQIQNQFKLESLDKYLGKISEDKLVPIPKVPMNKGIEWFAQMVDFMNENPPIGKHEFIWGMLSQVGVEKGKSFDYKNIDEAVKKGLEKGLEDGKKVVQWRIEHRPEMTESKWYYSDALGEERDNYFERAEWAVQGLICNSPKEALYFNIYHDLEGMPLNGSQKYEIHIPADKMPPVNAFWSITSYNEKRNFIPNEDYHYSVGMRDKNMKYNADGSLTFKVQSNKPEEGIGNWIPISEGERFKLNFRFYGPKEVMFDKDKVSDYLPPLTKVDFRN